MVDKSTTDPPYGLVMGKGQDGQTWKLLSLLWFPIYVAVHQAAAEIKFNK